MKRLTSDNVFEMSMTELALNQVFVRDGWAWYRKGPEDECSVCDLIRSAAAKGLWQENIDLNPNLTDEELGDVMLDWLQFGEEEPEGILAILHRALWAMAEVRERLKIYEDVCFAGDGTEFLTPWALQILREAREALRKDPLTLEELREMDGEPVWISYFAGGPNVCMLVDAKHDVCRDAHGGFAVFENLGRTWIAYRRRPEACANAE